MFPISAKRSPVKQPDGGILEAFFGFSAICRKSLMPKEGLEPSPTCVDRILNPARLPFRHFGAARGIFLIIPKIFQWYTSSKSRSLLSDFACGFALETASEGCRPLTTHHSPLTKLKQLPLHAMSVIIPMGNNPGRQPFLFHRPALVFLR
jgi:hypothetical protein